MPAAPETGRPFTLADLALEMRPIPAGTFRMGSPFDERGRTLAEGPQTWVTISRPFWLGRTAVTHAQWKAVMGTDLVEQARKGFPRETNPARLLNATADDVAMYFVNWHEAMAFCEKLNVRARAEGSLPQGYEFTLPTEAQWEYACRAGTTAATPAGPMTIISDNHAPVLDEIAWYAGNSSVGYQGRGWDTSGWPGKQYPGGPAGVRPVGLKQPNAWELYDMLGNVRQWCRDFASDALPGGKVTDPTGPSRGYDRMIRGGSWHSAAPYCRSAYRTWSIADGRLPFIGFRLALAPVPAK
jgi:formylglycine-generating enzyme required for sulfatase activity